MIRKYRYGTPFNTEALTEKIETTEGVLPYGEVSQEEGFVFTYIMDEDDIVYGLGSPGVVCSGRTRFSWRRVPSLPSTKWISPGKILRKDCLK